MTTRLFSAVHEAGHCAVAFKYGLPIHSVTIDANEDQHIPSYTCISFCPVLDKREIERVCVMYLAGRAAEKLYGIDSDSDKIDMQLVEKLLACDWLANGTIPERVARLQKRTHRLVRTSLLRFHIEMVRAMLFKQGTLSGDDVYALLGRTN